MKKFLYAITAVAVMLGAVACEPEGTEENPGGGDEPVKVKTVSVGAQTGTLTAGKAGNVTFAVATENIEDDEYTVSVSNLPAGVSAGKVTIADNAGILILTATDAIAEGATANLKLTLDGTQSNSFTLTVNGAPAVLAVERFTEDPDYVMVPGEGGMALYMVIVENIAEGIYPVTISGLEGSGVTIYGNDDYPDGVIEITRAEAPLSGEVTFAGALVLIGDDTVGDNDLEGLVLTIAGVQSDPFVLTMDAPAPVVPEFVSIHQLQKLYDKVAGATTFDLTMENIADGNYTIEISGLPEGVTLTSDQIAIASGKCEFSLTANGTQTTGVIPLTITVDGVTSPSFDLTISAKSIVVALSNPGMLTIGTVSEAEFTVASSSLAPGTYTPPQLTASGLPAGVTVKNLVINGANGGGILTIAGDNTTSAAMGNKVSITVDGVTSNQFSIYIM